MHTSPSRFSLFLSAFLLFTVLAPGLPAGDPDPAEIPAGPAALPPGTGEGGQPPRMRVEPERVLAALRQAYPLRIGEVARRDGDWAVRVDSQWFYWANGRLLPSALRAQWESYDPVPFYLYPPQLPPLPRFSESEKARIAGRVKEREKKPTRRHSGFTDALWRVHDRDSAWRRVKTTYFLGLKAEIHRDLLEDLAAVEEEIQAGMERDPQLAAFVKSIRQLSGYNWRRIDGTSSLSYHAYGAALDLVPASYGGKQAYWRWALPNFPEWYSLPYSSRFMPPAAFVQAFERHGFVWGGKWLFYDTIHFEYRPEILVLSGMTPAP